MFKNALRDWLDVLMTFSCVLSIALRKDMIQATYQMGMIWQSLNLIILAMLNLMILTKLTSYKRGVQYYIYFEKIENISLSDLFVHLDVTIGVYIRLSGLSLLKVTLKNRSSHPNMFRQENVRNILQHHKIMTPRTNIFLLNVRI